MMGIPVKIAAVSYLNTVPFVYGIKHAQELCAELLLSPPSLCAEAFKQHKVDIALVPVGALPELDDARIVTDYCIGADRSVRTVVVVSNAPIERARTLWLDSHSRTSVILVRILCNELWHINPAIEELTDYSVVDAPREGDAFLLIGDKVFDYEGRFAFSYDLSDEWRRLTGKPMVFAVWVARKGIDEEIVDRLEQALTLGMERIWEAIVEQGYSERDYAYDYLTRNIDFLYDIEKHKALELFWDKGLKAVPRAKPG